MSLYKQFETDGSIEKDGILLEYGTTEGGKPIRIRIARAGGTNKAYERLMEAEVKPYRRQIQNESIENAVVIGILRRVYAKTIVLGWENVEDRAGKPMDFSVENCVKLFEDLPDLFKDIQEQAQRASLFRKDILETNAKN